MADLIAIKGTHGEVTSHAIFFHGLGGHALNTWQSLIDPNVCWLQWLAEDIEGLTVWTIGYEAAISRWRGSAMHLTDRATNLLERILVEPRLQNGEVILIGHSLGGLVIKQLLRTAESFAHQRADADKFIRRVRRVAFLATPHTGVGLASWGNRLRIMIRPSAATASLVRNDPNLRDLNRWYRRWSRGNRIAHLILTENQRIRIAGQIVKADSSDPGLLEDPITVDEDHISICKPKDRSSEVYTHIQHFITRRLEAPPRERVLEAVKEQSTQLKALMSSTQDGYSRLSIEISEQGEKTAEVVADRLKKDLSALSSPVRYPTGTVDELIQKDLSILRRARFFEGFSRFEYSIRLAKKILNGEFEGGSDAVKSKALAWCSRIIAIGKHGDKSDQYLSQAKQLGNGPEIIIAEAFRVSANGDFDAALGKISDLDSPTARSAAFMIATNHIDASAAVDWLLTTGVTFSELDGDGKFFLITKLLELGRWNNAIEYAESLHEDDFLEAPALYYTAAMANLVQVIPEDLRSNVPKQVPFEAASFPLGSDEASLKHRREAHDLLKRSGFVMRELGCVEVAHLADDYALWLELRDPLSHNSGRQQLEASMRDQEHSLRRLRLALQFGLKLDLDAVEREIDRRTILSGGKLPDAAFARFSLAFTKDSPKGVADYIDRHRKQLEEHLGKKPIRIYEIEMLAAAGLSEQAEECLAGFVDDGFSDVEREHLRGTIKQTKSADPIAIHKAKFEQDGQLVDLAILVALLEERRDWPNLCHFGALLFERTKALRDAERLAMALNEIARFDELSAFLRKYAEFIDQSDNLQMLWSWSLYREGLLAESATALGILRAKRDHPNDRLLTVRLAVASGEWESLLPFIETEWANREKRSATDLIQVAQLAQFAGSPRARDLAYKAVDKDHENPHILVAAYGLATSAGWESTEEVSGWLNKAAELSDEKGPIQKRSLQDLMDRAPEWNRREVETWKQVNEGSLPVFCAAHLLNQSLIDLFLLPAIANTHEPDPRRRSLVPAYGGARQPIPCSFRKVAIDPTTLLTLGMLGLLDPTLKLFDRIVVPHSTLSWLFEQKEKVSFHQPSRIKKALDLRELLANGALKALSISARLDTDLAAEIGEELASLIAEASAGDTADGRQKVVVRASPVHRVGSLMDEEADLSSYSSHICNCSSVVNKLKQKGQLTLTEESRARSYLSLHEKDWPGQPPISDNAVLYLDDISVSYLQHTGLIAKLRSSGLEAFLSERTITEVNSLLRYEHLASRVGEVIEIIRNFLAAGIRSGKIGLTPMRPLDEADEDNIQNHPTFGLFSSATKVEAIVVDDRSLNKHGNFDTGSGRIPILTTLDLLIGLYSSGNITLDKLLECRTYLRRAGYLFVPVTNEELEHYLSATTVVDGRIVETAEIKAIRENLLRIRSTNFLQFPYEVPWLNDVMQTFTETLKAQWRPEVDESTARARSEWLLGLLDRRGWAHCFKGNVDLGNVRYWYGPQIMLLLSAAAIVSVETKQKYFQWVDECVLAAISEEDPDLYLWIIERAKELIAYVVEVNVSKDLE